MIKNQSGTVSLLMTGLCFGILLCAMACWLFISARMTHAAAGSAAEAAALAASQALQEAFVSDISPKAYAKLESLTKRITEDELFKIGEAAAAIEKHTVPSKLRDILLLGKRGKAITLDVLLQYKPFFSEYDVGREVADSFQRHLDDRIVPSVKDYLRKNRAEESGEIVFPVYKKIEVTAKVRFQSTLFPQFARNYAGYVTGRGNSFFLKILDENYISCNLSEVPVLRKQF